LAWRVFQASLIFASWGQGLPKWSTRVRLILMLDSWDRILNASFSFHLMNEHNKLGCSSLPSLTIMVYVKSSLLGPYEENQVL